MHLYSIFFTCNRNYFKWFCSRNSYAYGIYGSFYCRSNSRWYFISCERADGSCSLFRANVCAGDVLCCLTPSSENCNSPLGNQFLNLVKNSSILGIIAGADLMYQGDLISTKTFVTFDVYIFVGMFYLILTIPLSMLVRYLEKRLAKEAV